MEDGTPKPGETGAPETPKNGTQNSDSSEVEKLRAELKEAQQKAMRVGQVENELAKIKEAEDKRKQTELEEQNQFKDLYEQEKAKREKIEGDLAAGEASKKLKEATAEILADYPDELKTLANEAGITPASADEADMTAFKERLDKLQKVVGGTGKIGPNNPGNSNPNSQMSGDELKLAMKDQNRFEEIISKRPGIAALMDAKKK